MTRQGKTWLIIGAVFVALLVARGMIGQGLGRVYVKRTEVIVKLPDAAGVNSTAAGAASAIVCTEAIVVLMMASTLKRAGVRLFRINT